MATSDRPRRLTHKADLVSLDATAATGHVPSTSFRPKAPRPITVVVSKMEPKLEAFPVPEPDANPAPPLEVDVAVDAPRHGDGADKEDFVVREINVYFNPRPLQDHAKGICRQTPYLCDCNI
jgi:DNA-directed RNA polymerase III subunit RPC5